MQWNAELWTNQQSGCTHESITNKAAALQIVIVLETSLVLVLPLIKRKRGLSVPAEISAPVRNSLHGKGHSLPLLTLVPAGSVWVQPLQGCCSMQNCSGTLSNDLVLKFMT